MDVCFSHTGVYSLEMIFHLYEKNMVNIGNHIVFEKKLMIIHEKSIQMIQTI